MRYPYTKENRSKPGGNPMSSNPSPSRLGLFPMITPEKVYDSSLHLS